MRRLRRWRLPGSPLPDELVIAAHEAFWFAWSQCRVLVDSGSDESVELCVVVTDDLGEDVLAEGMAETSAECGEFGVVAVVGGLGVGQFGSQ